MTHTYAELEVTPMAFVEIKQLPLGVVLSLATGRLFCAFSEMHEAAEFLTGGAVWTHQFAHRPFCQEMAESIYVQHPELRAVNVGRVTTKNWRAFLQRQEARFGATLSLQPMAAVESLAAAFTEPLKGKAVLIVKASAPRAEP